MVKKIKTIPILILLSIHTAFAQTAAAESNNGQVKTLLKWSFTNVLAIAALIISIMALIVLYRVFNLLFDLNRQHFIEKYGIEVSKEANLFDREPLLLSLYKRLTKATPLNQEASIDLGHNYDGIRELDNSLPPWWLYLFYGCILFSVVYMWNYHWKNGKTNQLDEYAAQMDEGEKVKSAYLAKVADAINETNVIALKETKRIEDGKTIFNTLCKACHLETGAGSVGPNLTDDYWLHGGGIKNIFKTIKYGVPAKGMISWQEQLRPSDMQNVSSYILTLKGSNPPYAKGPQGDLYKEGADAASMKSDTLKK
jgi:cytochrome c oxidase cbb3-type subunit III